MKRRRVPYLRMCRRRACFSQHDVAFLLGLKARSKISRYERSICLPLLRTALAYEVMFGRPVADLFHSSYGEVSAEVRRRAALLLEKDSRSRTPAMALRRKESLQAILSR